MKNNLIFYWDTSAILSLIYEELSSTAMKRYVEKNVALPGFTSFFTLLEMESALGRRTTSGLSSDQIPTIRLRMKTLEPGLSLIWPDEELLQKAKSCVLEYNLRPGDAIQLASSQELSQEFSDIVFVTLDEKLSRAAKAAGFRTN